MKHYLLGSAVALLMAVTPAYSAGDLEWNTDRPGYDYKGFDLPLDNPLMCKEACAGEPACKAYTYVKAGVLSVNSRCYLKNAVPNSMQNTATISGVKPN